MTACRGWWPLQLCKVFSYSGSIGRYPLKLFPLSLFTPSHSLWRPYQSHLRSSQPYLEPFQPQIMFAKPLSSLVLACKCVEKEWFNAVPDSRHKSQINKSLLGFQKISRKFDDADWEGRRWRKWNFYQFSHFSLKFRLSTAFYLGFAKFHRS